MAERRDRTPRAGDKTGSARATTRSRPPPEPRARREPARGTPTDARARPRRAHAKVRPEQRPNGVSPSPRDLRASNELWERHHALVRRYLLQRCPPEAAEDLAQEALMRVWESSSRPAEDEHLPAYMITVARNLWIDHLRWQRNWGNVVSLEDVVLHAKDLETQVAESLWRESVRDGVERLSPRRRAVFELRWLKGFSHREIAARLEITVKTVENHLNAAYRELRDFFHETEMGGDRALREGS